MRLIDADALINELECYAIMTEHIADFDESVTETRYEGFKMALGHVKEFVKGADVSGNGWISVKERLPEKEEDVLAVKRLKDGRTSICIARCIPDWECRDYTTGKVKKIPYWVCGGNNNIIYWMPLPEMPEEVDG